MVESKPIYQQIIEKISQDIQSGQLKPGDRLSPLRDLTRTWHCTPGTVQRAYLELARAGLVTCRPGQGTHVAGTVEQNPQPLYLRRATLANRAEAFFIESITAGYDLDDIQQAMGVVLDRWRSLSAVQPKQAGSQIIFIGSHDLALTWLAIHFPEIIPGWQMEYHFSGSLGGLIALAEGKATLTGCHLWDDDSQTYNLPFIRRLLPHKPITTVTLAQRRLGLILAPGNPLKITSLNDLARPEVRFINRQSGSGTRVWLDSQLEQLGIPAAQIPGYSQECATHTEIARAVAGNKANAGLGLEQAARVFGLEFIFLTLEKYDLVMTSASAGQPPLSDLLIWLGSPAAHSVIGSLGGYVTTETGAIHTI